MNSDLVGLRSGREAVPLKDDVTQHEQVEVA